MQYDHHTGPAPCHPAEPGPDHPLSAAIAGQYGRFFIQKEITNLFDTYTPLPLSKDARALIKYTKEWLQHKSSISEEDLGHVDKLLTHNRVAVI